MANFNLNSSWGAAEVAALLGSVRDDRTWRMVVSKAGVVSLLDVAAGPHPTPDSHHCWWESWNTGNDYVGPEAAADAKWVGDLVTDLKRNWPKTVSGPYIDH